MKTISLAVFAFCLYATAATAACYETCQSKCRMNWKAEMYNSQAACVADWSARNETSGSSDRIRAQRGYNPSPEDVRRARKDRNN